MMYDMAREFTRSGSETVPADSSRTGYVEALLRDHMSQQGHCNTGGASYNRNMNLHFRTVALCVFGSVLASACSGESSGTSSGFASGCPVPPGVVMTEPQVTAATSAIKNLLAGKLSFDLDPGVTRILTDSRRADLIVAGLMCTAQKRDLITTNDTSRLEYTRKLFLYTWGTSPTPVPEDVQAWTVSHPYSHVTSDPAPSAENPTFEAERFDAIDPASDTCTQRTIPAGVPVCVRLKGDPAVGLFAVEAKDHEVPLTSIRSGEPANWLKQNVDYAVCIRPKLGTQQGAAQEGHVAVEISRTARGKCLEKL
jgi:hypothetical protein